MKKLLHNFRSSGRIKQLTKVVRISTGLVALVVLAAMAMPSGVDAASVWQNTANPLPSPHGRAGTTKLLNGKVLVTSGQVGSSLTAATDIYDPATDTWSASGDVNQPRYGNSEAITLNNGKVLIAGGTDATASTDYDSAELYDPATGQWSFTGSLNTSRRNPAAVKLQDGCVLMASGAHGAPDGGRFLFNGEIYDPNTGQWSYTGPMNVGREGGTSAILHDGRVMMLGGEGPWFTQSPAVELYNPATNSWSLTGSLPHGITGPTLTVLNDGRVLAASGSYTSTLNEAQLFNPATGTWTAAAPMNHARSGAQSALLSDGRVLVAGGSDAANNGVLVSEIYNPATNTWTDDAPLQNMHNAGRMVKLDNGTLLMVGGYNSTAATTASEVYVPSAPPPPPLRYTALGDSYSSGDGAGTYATQACRVSPYAFANFLSSDHPDLNLTPPLNLACQGSTTADIASTQVPKLQADNSIQPVKLVSITAGGNNVGFKDVLTQCYEGALEGAALTVSLADHGVPGGIAQRIGDTLATNRCVNQNGQVEARIRTLGKQLPALYDAIHTAAPQATVLAVGYPMLFPQNATTGCALLTADSIQWINQKTDSLNNAISASVTQTNANAQNNNKFRYVNSSDALQGHDVCSVRPWVNPFNAVGDATPYHPNANGYKAWANTIADNLTSNPL